MQVPSYWAEARVQHRERGRQVTVRRYGWSDDSDAEARLLAELRAADALKRILAGENLPRRDRKIPYGGTEGLPIREEVVARHGNAVLTRNEYGALCLNTPDALFVDVDLADPMPGSLQRGTAVVLVALALALGWVLRFGWIGFGLLVVAALIASYFLAESVWSRTAARRVAPEQRAQARIAAFAAAHPDWALRVYRTPAGFRVLATHRTFLPDDPEVETIFAALDADPTYTWMCRQQHCFRARVSPKPWRIGIDRHLRPRPGVWPIKPEHLPARRAWVADYERKAQGFAACRFETALGPDVVHADVASTLAWHDELARAASGLPIA